MRTRGGSATEVCEYAEESGVEVGERRRKKERKRSLWAKRIQRGLRQRRWGALILLAVCTFAAATTVFLMSRFLVVSFSRMLSLWVLSPLPGRWSSPRGPVSAFSAENRDAARERRVQELLRSSKDQKTQFRQGVEAKSHLQPTSRPLTLTSSTTLANQGVFTSLDKTRIEEGSAPSKTEDTEQADSEDAGSSLEEDEVETAFDDLPGSIAPISDRASMLTWQGGDGSWQFVPANIKKLMEDETVEPRENEPSSSGQGVVDAARDGQEGWWDEVTGILRMLVKRVNWSNVQGRGHDRPKEAVVLGTASIIKRDFGAISQAYAAEGLKVEQASELSPAVARGIREGNLAAVRGKTWGLILCLSLSTEKCLTDRDFVRLESEQGSFSRVNRIAALQQVLWSKDMYCRTVQWSGAWLPAFTFPCWVLPKDDSALLDRVRTLRDASGGKQSQAASPRWIVKPYKQGGGKGIRVLDSLEEVQQLVERSGVSHRVVVQPYLQNPHLLESRKWDMRTYVLVTSATPVARAYVYSEGLVRLASDKYEQSASHGGNKTQFLTNTSINKKVNADVNSLTWSFGKLEESIGSAKFGLIMSRLQRAIGMLLVTAEQRFTREFQRIGQNFGCNTCFHLLGVDVIVDSDLVPRVIEVNGEPSMQLSGAQQSHYDSTKNGMQREVARIVLHAQPKLSRSLAASLSRARLRLGQGGDAQWLVRDEKAMLYLLHVQREWLNKASFRPVYPDPFVCQSHSRREMWKGLLEQLYGSSESELSRWRLQLHAILEKLVCALETSSTE